MTPVSMYVHILRSVSFFSLDTRTTGIYTLSLTTLFRSPARLAQRPGGVPLSARSSVNYTAAASSGVPSWNRTPGRSLKRRSEEHTSELQSHSDLVCRLLLEKKKRQKIQTN